MNQIHQFELGFSNCFLITGGSPVLVDTGMAGSPEDFKNMCASCGLKPSDIELIIISHEHADHFVNLGWMLEMADGAQVLCHEAAKESLSHGLAPQVVARNSIAEEAAKSPPPLLVDIPCVAPDITFSEEYDLRPHGISGKILSTPGHSDGSTAIILDTGEAIVGDTVVQRPGGDEPVIAFLASDVAALKKSVEQLLSEASVFYSGHGGPYTAEEVREAYAKDNF